MFLSKWTHGLIHSPQPNSTCREIQSSIGLSCPVTVAKQYLDDPCLEEGQSYANLAINFSLFFPWTFRSLTTEMLWLWPNRHPLPKGTVSIYESVPSCRAVTHYIIVLTNMLIMNLCSSLWPLYSSLGESWSNIASPVYISTHTATRGSQSLTLSDITQWLFSWKQNRCSIFLYILCLCTWCTTSSKPLRVLMMGHRKLF